MEIRLNREFPVTKEEKQLKRGTKCSCKKQLQEFESEKALNHQQCIKISCHD